MIVLDLEWNRGYDKKPLDEVLQIGAVRMDGLGGPITDTFNVYIRPRVHKCLNHLAKELPELASILASQLTFPNRAGCGGFSAVVRGRAGVRRLGWGRCGHPEPELRVLGASRCQGGHHI